MRNYFTLDGVDSRDFGVYISGQGTFNASGRDYNIIPVPGRNGDLVGPEKRFLNGTLTYPAFIYANFKQQIEAFRNFLLSLVGYHDLIDSYHPNEIRKVLFEGPFSADVEPKNDAGRFDIEFNCKPQRYLASGQEVIIFEAGAGETETYSGEVATFDNSDSSSISALSVAVEPVQDLHGYDSPWPAGGNINKLDPTVSYSGLTYNPAVGRVFTPTVSTNKWTDNGDGTFGITLDDWAQAGFVIGPLPSGAVYFSFASATGGLRISVFVMDSDFAVNRVSTNRNPITEGDAVAVNTTFSGTDTYLGVYIGGAAQAATISQPCVYTGADAPIRTYYPYSNICPISGWDAVNIWNKPTHDTTLPPTATIQLGQTVYGGTLDVTAGKMYARPYFPSYNGQALIGPWVSSMDAYTPGASPTVGAQVVDMGGAVTEITLDPVTISTISGQNNVWADAGDVTVEVFTPEKPVVTNPTRFDARPLLRVYGTGTLGIGSQSVTITQADVYTDIDCEMMDAFKGTANKNPYVQLTDYNFPVFAPGVNNISLGAGITQVDITPRWWVV